VCFCHGKHLPTWPYPWQSGIQERLVFLHPRVAGSLCQVWLSPWSFVSKFRKREVTAKHRFSLVTNESLRGFVRGGNILLNETSGSSKAHRTGTAVGGWANINECYCLHDCIQSIPKHTCSLCFRVHLWRTFKSHEYCKMKVLLVPTDFRQLMYEWNVTVDKTVTIAPVLPCSLGFMYDILYSVPVPMVTQVERQITTRLDKSTSNTGPYLPYCRMVRVFNMHMYSTCTCIQRLLGGGE